MQIIYKPKQKHSLLERIAIGACLFVSLVALIIIMFVIKIAKHLSTIDFDEQYITVVEETQSTIKVEIPEYLPEVELLKNDTTKDYGTEVEIQEINPVIETDVKPKKLLPIIKNMEDNLSEWCLANDSTNSISIWKVSDGMGNLLISLRDDEGNFLATFRFEGIDSEYEEWVRCDYFYDKVTISDLIDYSFVSYHEVGGRNAENVQAQVAVLINRQNHIDYSNILREVVTQNGQYSCAKWVANRWLKSNSYLESEDLEKCFQQTLLYLAGEFIQEVPANVGFAAPWEQGSGIWKVINGTYYCFF